MDSEPAAKPDIIMMGTFTPQSLSRMAEHFVLHSYFAALPNGENVRAALAPRIRAIATDPSRGASRAVMDLFPDLGIVATCGVGVDSIDLAAARERGIRVTNTPDILTEDVAELAIGLMLASARRIVEADRFVRSGTWRPREMALGRRIKGRIMGIVGLGRIGGAIAARAAALGMTILYTGPRRKQEAPYEYVSAPVELARRADVLMLSCRGGPETRHLVDAEVLAALGPTGTLVNVARGSVVDEAALIAALRAGRIGAAALDVFEDEPRVPPALLADPNVIVQPHHASGTIETRDAMGDLVIANLRAYFAGQALPTPVV